MVPVSVKRRSSNPVVATSGKFSTSAPPRQRSQNRRTPPSLAALIARKRRVQAGEAGFRPGLEGARRAERPGHTLWYQVDPSFTWLPFFRILRLHFGHVPIGSSFGSRCSSTGGYYIRTARRRREPLRVLPHHRPPDSCRHRVRG